MSYTYYPRNKLLEPDLNISNGYAHVPAEMMHVSFDRGVVPVSELQSALERARVAPLDPHVVSDLQDGNITHYGRTRDDILHYRNRIVEILEVCIKEQVPLHWS